MAGELTLFNQAIERSEHFLFLYDLVSNKRTRAVRSDWADRFKGFMRWPPAARIMRVDGDCSILIIKDGPMGLTYDRFEHSYVSELLRSSLVSAVSASDKYFHDKSLNVCFKLLNGPEKDLPKKLRLLELPVVQTFKAVKKVRANSSARPGSQLKKAIQDKLHLSTFQGSHGIEECFALMGVKKVWAQIAEEWPSDVNAEDIKSKLDKVCRRRNQIVHEADLERKISSNRFALREIKRSFAQDSVDFVKDFIVAADKVIERETK